MHTPPAWVALSAAMLMPSDQRPRKILVAHRGASAYAPEHTLAAYRLAIEQGADFVEQDLQISKDGVLVCLHDLTLERTTDVAAIFPDLDLPENLRQAWGRMLKVEAPVG